METMRQSRCGGTSPRLKPRMRKSVGSKGVVAGKASWEAVLETTARNEAVVVKSMMIVISKKIVAAETEDRANGKEDTPIEISRRLPPGFPIAVII